MKFQSFRQFHLREDRLQDYKTVESFTKSILHFVHDSLFLWVKANPVLGAGALALFPIRRGAQFGCPLP